MPITLIEEVKGKLISVSVSGKLAKQDYEHIMPEVERLIEKYGKTDILLRRRAVGGY